MLACIQNTVSILEETYGIPCVQGSRRLFHQRPTVCLDQVSWLRGMLYELEALT